MVERGQISIFPQSPQLNPTPQSIQSIQIHIFLHIFLTICRIKTMSSDLESSNQALSIGSIIKAKYQSFVNVLN